MPFQSVERGPQGMTLTCPGHPEGVNHGHTFPVLPRTKDNLWITARVSRAPEVTAGQQ